MARAVALMWISNRGSRMESPLQNPQPIHGAADPHGILLWMLVDGVRLDVARHGYSWAVEGEHGVEAIAAEVELADESLWWAVRDLRSGRWTGEPIDVEKVGEKLRIKG